MLRKKEKRGLTALILGILVIATILVFYSFFSNTPGIKISCKEGKVLGFEKMSMPLMCTGCPFNCKVNIEVRDNENNLICLNSYNEEDIVVVPCPELKNHKGEELLIKFSINSSYNNLSGEERLTYEK